MIAALVTTGVTARLYFANELTLNNAQLNVGMVTGKPADLMRPYGLLNVVGQVRHQWHPRLCSGRRQDDR